MDAFNGRNVDVNDEVEISDGACVKQRRPRLSAAELELIAARRKLTAAQVERPMPAKLLEHGYVSKAEAARLLGVTAAKITQLEKAPGEGERRLPRYNDGECRGYALSDLRREYPLLRRARLVELAKRVVDQVLPTGTSEAFGGWEPLWYELPLHGDSDLNLYFERTNGPRGLDVGGIAKRFGVTKGYAQHLMDGPLACKKARGNRGTVRSVVTFEEIEAYERKLAAKASTKRQVAA